MPFDNLYQIILKIYPSEVLHHPSLPRLSKLRAQRSTTQAEKERKKQQAGRFQPKQSSATLSSSRLKNLRKCAFEAIDVVVDEAALREVVRPQQAHQREVPAYLLRGMKREKQAKSKRTAQCSTQPQITHSHSSPIHDPLVSSLFLWSCTARPTYKENHSTSRR